MKNIRITICAAVLTGLFMSSGNILYHRTTAATIPNVTQHTVTESLQSPTQPDLYSQCNDGDIISVIPYDAPQAEVPFYTDYTVYKRIKIIYNPTLPVSFLKSPGICVEL